MNRAVIVQKLNEVRYYTEKGMKKNTNNMRQAPEQNKVNKKLSKHFYQNLTRVQLTTGNCERKKTIEIKRR